MLFRAVIFIAILSAGLSAPGIAAAQTAAPTRPPWLGQEPLVIAGNWDSMPIFQRRVGRAPVWHDEDYRREHSEETVLKLKELGVTMAVIHFYKGYGLEAEKEHMEDARKLAALCKKHGIRVGVYVGSTVAYETFLHERPDITEWFVPRHLGRPVIYFDQSFRKRVYFMHPGYREYMKRVVRIAIEDFKADLIHFDNTSLQAQPPVFVHPRAVEDFREFLRRKYTPAQREQRFGFPDLSYVEAPEIDRPLTTIIDPLLQEWADFRCERLTAYYAEMRAFIRGLNPEVAVENNPHSGISGENTVWDQGVDYPRLLAQTDIVWSEEGNEAGVNANGVLISKIRTYKMAARLGNSIFTYTADAQGGPLQMAEAMAYNRQNLGMVGGVLAGYDLPESHRRYVRFFRDNFDLYRGVESRPDVAVLHSFASMAFNNDLPWQSSMLFQQALIQAKVPFDIVFDDHLKDLSRYRALVLPDQECLTDEQIGLIRDYVRQGGGLVATELTSLYTEWRRRRREFGLGDLLPVRAPAWRGPGPEALLETPLARHEAGKGRVAYVSRVEAAVEKPAGAPMTSRYWKLPHNWEALVEAVKWAAGGRLSLEVQAPLTVTAELLEQRDPNRLLVHLLNYDNERRPEIPALGVAARLGSGRSVAAVTLVSPDADRAETLAFEERGGTVAFTVPRLRTYSVAVIQLK
ncbi:MAG: beta-galactosidase trimerization domain-containing protein [Bryobacteraceae bacterium]|nr:beta-galactosidase trimerization domain-containing protein [Bryobacteraceae bacterium]